MDPSRGPVRSGHGARRLAGGVGAGTGDGGGEEAQAVSIETAIAVDRAVNDMRDLADDGLANDLDPAAVVLVGLGDAAGNGRPSGGLLNLRFEAGAVLLVAVGLILLRLMGAAEDVDGHSQQPDSGQPVVPGQRPGEQGADHASADVAVARLPRTRVASAVPAQASI